MSLNFDFSEENTMLVSAVGDALRPWTGERKAELREMVNSSVFPAELWQTFAEIGLMGCLVPEQYGGTDVGLLPLALAFEKIAAMGISPNILLLPAWTRPAWRAMPPTLLKNNICPVSSLARSSSVLP